MKTQKILADLHLHSTFSDGKLTIPEIVDLFGKRGFGAIAITDHLCESATFLGKAAGYLNQTLTPETFPRYQAILKSEAERARREYGMLLIPGFELTKNTILNHRSAHILALGVTSFIDANLGIEEICAEIRKQGGLSVAAHPVSTRRLEKQTYFLWDRRDQFRETFDAWEVASGRHFFDEVAESGLRLIANSDMHRPEQMESWKTVFTVRGPETPGSDIPRPLFITWDQIISDVRSQSVEFTYYREGLPRVARRTHMTSPIRRRELKWPLKTRRKSMLMGLVALSLFAVGLVQWTFGFERG